MKALFRISIKADVVGQAKRLILGEFDKYNSLLGEGFGLPKRKQRKYETLQKQWARYIGSLSKYEHRSDLTESDLKEIQYLIRTERPSSWSVL
jgi:hypothetical protein